MDAKEFYITVKAMREAQKLYFRTRAACHLEKSKELEKAIDDEIKRTEAVLKERDSRRQLNFLF